MRAFVKMRKMLLANEELDKKFAEIEDKLGEHDEHFRKVFTAIKLLISPPKKDRKQIGYIQKPKNPKTWYTDEEKKEFLRLAQSKFFGRMEINQD